eukprot:2093822-Lingulodinium_polyedra.AAC.1
MATFRGVTVAMELQGENGDAKPWGPKRPCYSRWRAGALTAQKCPTNVKSNVAQRGSNMA